MSEEKQEINGSAVGAASGTDTASATSVAGAAGQPITSTSQGVANVDRLMKAKKKAKRSMGWKIATGVLAVAALGLVGFLVYHFVATDHSEKQCEEMACEVTEVKDEETGETVKVVKVPVGNSKEDVAVRELVDKLFNIAVNMTYGDNGWRPNLVRSYDETVVLFKPDGLNVAVPLSLVYGFNFTWDGSSTEYANKENIILNGDLSAALIGELTRNGFVEYEYTPFTSVSYINKEAGIVCAIGGSGLPYEIGCGSVNWYVTDNWDLLNELAEAFKEKKGSYPISLGVNPANIKDSGYEQYQTLSVSIENAMGMFYRTSPNSEWVFFRDGQDAPDCTEYNTEDLKRAFVGTTCWNDVTKALDKVKL